MAKAARAEQAVTISPPKFEVIELNIEGTSPYMQLKFSEKAKAAMMGKMAEGSTGRSKNSKAARNFDQDMLDASYIAAEGWRGIPASAFRQAMISACRTVEFKMTIAKLSIFIEADGFDRQDGTPLVQIYGEPRRSEMPVRNATGVADIRIRPLWDKWSARVRVRFDTDQFKVSDIVNLFSRVGMQVGIGEGRPDSKKSAGLGFGLFRIV